MADSRRQTRWQWAWRHRRWFTSIGKDAVGGAVLGAFRLAVPAFAATWNRATPDWTAVVIQGVLIAFVVAFLLPVAEAFSLWLRYPRLRAEEQVQALSKQLRLLEDDRDALRKQLEVRPRLQLREPGAIHTDDIAAYREGIEQPLFIGNFLHVR